MCKKSSCLKYIVFAFIVLLFIGLCLLGRWQLSRGYEKKALIQAQQQKSQETSIGRATLQSVPIGTLRYQPVSLKIQLNLEKSFLLDNQMHQGKIGYHVLVPLEINEEVFILLNIGWVPAPISRDQLPNIANIPLNTDNLENHPINGEIPIEGYVEKGYVNPLISKTLESETVSWPLRIQHMDYPLFSQILGGKVLPGIIILEKPKIPNVFPLPKSQTWLTPEKHFGYAFQWFSMSAALLVMTLLSLRKLRKS